MLVVLFVVYFFKRVISVSVEVGSKYVKFYGLCGIWNLKKLLEIYISYKCLVIYGLLNYWDESF